MKQNNTTTKNLNQNKMTAVEWLERELIGENGINVLKDVFEQAKEIEKQQIIEAYIECKRQYVLQGNCYPPQFVVKEAEQYYNETFKKK